jgi:beta-mannosidase
MRQIPLDIANWTVRAVGDLSAVPMSLRGREVAARVPGCVHTDLMRADLIPDPLVGMNEREVQWIGETDWEYRAVFEADAELFKHERIDLVCEGLDTIAEVRVNGTEVGRAANMFHPHRFDLRTALRAGTNELSITFRSPLKHIRAEEARLGKRPVNGEWDPYIFVRKAACNFGWDWAPKLATCGIWKAIRVEIWNAVRIAGVRPHANHNLDGSWTLDVDIDLEWSGSGPRGSLVAGVEANAEDDPDGILDSSLDVVERGASTVRRTLKFPRVTPWSPRGAGTQRLYPLEVWLTDSYEIDDFIVEVIDESRLQIGFRTVRLGAPSPKDPGPFSVQVGSREVFCKGANWIPEGPWPAEVSRETLRKRLEQAAAANINMLRVWGGGYYESDAFYEICDELGIMVWQDFMFSCAMYPEEQPYPKLIEEEARHQIARLSSHPSVVLWCGGNECVWAHDAWGNAPGERPWKERLAGKTWGKGYYFDLLPRLLKELDPSRPYWPNSPWAGDAESATRNPHSVIAPNSADHGDRHTWDLRGEAYRKLVPRFCSEFGHQSPSDYATLASVLRPEDLKCGSPALEHHQRATGGTAGHIDEAIAELFRPPRDFDEWHFLAQLTQARAMQTGIEWLRVNRPRCMGALIWQLNDCWPGMSWSLIDSGGREKLAYHAAKEAFRNRLITIQPFDERPWLCVVNDNDEPAHYKIDLQRLSFDGTVLAASTLDAVAGSCASERVCDLQRAIGVPTDPRKELIVADAPGHRATWFYLPDRELSYPSPRFEFTEENGGARSYRVVSKTLVRDVTLLTDRAPGLALCGPMLRTLLPGESFQLEVNAKPEIRAEVGDGDKWIRPPVLWCANMFGAPSTK